MVEMKEYRITSRQLVERMEEISRVAGLTVSQMTRAFEEMSRVLRRSLPTFCVSSIMYRAISDKANEELEERPWSVLLRWKAMKTFIRMRRYDLKRN